MASFLMSSVCEKCGIFYNNIISPYDNNPLTQGLLCQNTDGRIFHQAPASSLVIIPSNLQGGRCAGTPWRFEQQLAQFLLSPTLIVSGGKRSEAVRQSLKPSIPPRHALHQFLMGRASLLIHLHSHQTHPAPSLGPRHQILPRVLILEHVKLT